MYQYKTLSNGIKVVAEKIDYLKSISIGVWVGNGSRYENKEVNVPRRKGNKSFYRAYAF